MYIKELQLYGFKSFPHKSILRLSTGISAIVGPNGCGKSNILDALRWVLGEQSFSLLRCAKNEDLIFSGTAKIPALGYAEVRLILDNSDSAASSAPDGLPSGSEIEIRRRYFRSGESEFFLNRNPCRLKDIQDVFFNTGTGTKGYCIFDLNSLRAIIAGELRPMFEEAATLAKYRERRSDCLRKLELTDSDLLRLDDIIRERERMVRSLRRQAYRLAAFERLRAEQSRLRLILLKADYERAWAAEQAAERAAAQGAEQDACLQQAIAEQERQLDDLQRELNARRASYDRLRASREELNLQLNQLRLRQAAARSEIERLTAVAAEMAAADQTRELQIQEHGQAQAELATRLREFQQQEQQLSAELEQYQSATREREAHLFRLRSELSRTRASYRELFEQRITLQQDCLNAEAARANAAELNARLRTDLERHQAELAALHKTRAQVNDRLAAVRSSIEQLRAGLQEYRQDAARLHARQEELLRQAAELRNDQLAAAQERAQLQPFLHRSRAVAAASLGTALRGELSRFLTVKSGWEPAVAAVLAGLIDSLIITSDAKPLLPKLDRKERWQFLFQDHPDQNLAPSSPSGSLLEVVELAPEVPGIVRRLLSNARIVPDWEALLKSAPSDDSTILVTPDGWALFPDGRVVLESAETSPLVIERRVRELETREQELQAELKKREEERSRLLSAGAELEPLISSREEELITLISQYAQLEAELNTLKLRSSGLEQEIARLATEASAAARQEQEWQLELQRLRSELDSVLNRISESESSISRLESEAGEMEKQVRDGLEGAAGVLLQLTSLRERLQGLSQESTRHQKALEQLRTEQAAGKDRHQRNCEELLRWQQELQKLDSEISDRQQQLTGIEAELNGIDLTPWSARAAELQQRIQELRSEQEAGRQQTMDLRLKLLEARHRREELEREAQHSYQTDIAQFTAEPVPDIENRLQLICARLERLGRVNPLAAEDYSRERSELERLTGQRADVVTAKENLLKIIAEIDRYAQEQFLTTFQAVRSHFQEIFARLFVEGEADLILETPANPLESDIRIVARPRGKSPKRLDQLSDGEKALLALSLLFAFYRTKPAPFVFLDEVDAPLDDANVDRFALFLKELARTTQVVIITHNRATVEQADVLLGVTTEEPGVSKIVSVRLGDFDQARRRLIPPAS